MANLISGEIQGKPAAVELDWYEHTDRN